jgi:hypothetical protein
MNNTWQPGNDNRTRIMAAGLLLVLAAMSFITIGLALFAKVGAL